MVAVLILVALVLLALVAEIASTPWCVSES